MSTVYSSICQLQTLPARILALVHGARSPPQVSALEYFNVNIRSLRPLTLKFARTEWNQANMKTGTNPPSSPAVKASRAREPQVAASATSLAQDDRLDGSQRAHRGRYSLELDGREDREERVTTAWLRNRARMELSGSITHPLSESAQDSSCRTSSTTSPFPDTASTSTSTLLRLFGTSSLTTASKSLKSTLVFMPSLKGSIDIITSTSITLQIPPKTTSGDFARIAKALRDLPPSESNTPSISRAIRPATQKHCSRSQHPNSVILACSNVRIISDASASHQVSCLETPEVCRQSYDIYQRRIYLLAPWLLTLSSPDSDVNPNPGRPLHAFKHRMPKSLRPPKIIRFKQAGTDCGFRPTAQLRILTACSLHGPSRAICKARYVHLCLLRRAAALQRTPSPHFHVSEPCNTFNLPRPSQHASAANRTIVTTSFVPMRPRQALLPAQFASQRPLLVPRHAVAAHSLASARRTEVWSLLARRNHGDWVVVMELWGNDSRLPHPAFHGRGLLRVIFLSNPDAFTPQGAQAGGSSDCVVSRPISSMRDHDVATLLEVFVRQMVAAASAEVLRNRFWVVKK
ncbi:hypothetical protein CVT26_009245 [Gymnopilus dilepis]|uniref:Uncharacterized protein n=1 Tax=Gymnopilus dilepis TaxID=231916 RepID=A0A409YRQ2_9AGAR|nr:hypothetical protein CVT26_009245 [Gymnopilus dilepis]